MLSGRVNATRLTLAAVFMTALSMASVPADAASGGGGVPGWRSGEVVPTQLAQGFCSSVYNPVCGAWRGRHRTFTNFCRARRAGATNLRRGRCSAAYISTPQQVVWLLTGRGFNSISRVRRIYRGNRAVYTAYGRRGGQLYRIEVGAQYGRILQARPVAAPVWTPLMTQQQIIAELRNEGFRNIRMVRRVARGRRTIYIARGNRGGQRYRIEVDAQNGRILQARRIAAPVPVSVMTPPQAKSVLRGKGFRNIRIVRRVAQGGRTIYIARGNRGGQRYRIKMDARTGRILLSSRIAAPVPAPVMTPPQAKSALRGKGFRNIQIVRRVAQGGRTVYIARGNRGGRRYRIKMDARTGRILLTRPVRAAGGVAPPPSPSVAPRRAGDPCVGKDSQGIPFQGRLAVDQRGGLNCLAGGGAR